MVDIKTQTNRTTKFIRDIKNINTFLNGFEFGIVTSKYWGDFESRKNPLIEITIKGHIYQILLKDFIKKIKPILKKNEVKYYNQRTI